MQRLSYPTKTVLANKITRNRIVLSFKDSPRKPLGRRPKLHAQVVSRRGQATVRGVPLTQAALTLKSPQ